MLNRLLIGAAGLVAGSLVATPAVLGLSGNSSFTRDIQVPVPSGAHRVSFEHGTSGSVSPTLSPASTHRRGHDDGPAHDLGDDHGGSPSDTSRSGQDDGPTHDLGDDHGAGSGRDGSGSGHSGRSGSDDSGHGGHG